MFLISLTLSKLSFLKDGLQRKATLMF